MSNTDHIMEVVLGGSPAPSINIVCPHYLNGSDPQEQHIIYSVTVVELDPKRCVMQCGFLSHTEKYICLKKEIF